MYSMIVLRTAGIQKSLQGTAKTELPIISHILKLFLGNTNNPIPKRHRFPKHHVPTNANVALVPYDPCYRCVPSACLLLLEDKIFCASLAII